MYKMLTRVGLRRMDFLNIPEGCLAGGRNRPLLAIRARVGHGDGRNIKKISISYAGQLREHFIQYVRVGL